MLPIVAALRRNPSLYVYDAKSLQWMTRTVQRGDAIRIDKRYKYDAPPLTLEKQSYEVIQSVHRGLLANPTLE